MTEPTTAAPVILVTGLSGAGKSSALKALEDLGFEAVDNVPLRLLGRLVLGDTGAQPDQPLAVGIDIRTRGFDADALAGQLSALRAQGAAIRVLFVDCADDELIRRFEETRRRHPLALDRPVSDGIAMERRLLGGMAVRADVVLDTTGSTLGEMKRALNGHFGRAFLGGQKARGLAVFVTSFAYRGGLPREADLVFDVRFLANPHYDAALKPLNGRDPGVGAYIRADDGFDAFLEGLTGLLAILLPRYHAEGKSYLTIAFGCTGGRHRSVFVAQTIADWLEKQGEMVHLLHRDLDGAAGQETPTKGPEK